MKAACEKSQAGCTSLKKEKKTVSPPKLFDLTALQREANRLYGFTAKQTLDYAQAPVSYTHLDVYKRQIITFVMCYELIQLVIEKNTGGKCSRLIFCSTR